jgi:hypothetical protein
MLHARCPRSRASVPNRNKQFFSTRNPPDRFWGLASGHSVSFPRCKATGVENEWSLTSTTPYNFMLCTWTTLAIYTKYTVQCNTADCMFGLPLLHVLSQQVCRQRPSLFGHSNSVLIRKDCDKP